MKLNDNLSKNEIVKILEIYGAIKLNIRTESHYYQFNWSNLVGNINAILKIIQSNLVNVCLIDNNISKEW